MNSAESYLGRLKWKVHSEPLLNVQRDISISKIKRIVTGSFMMLLPIRKF